MDFDKKRMSGAAYQVKKSGGASDEETLAVTEEKMRQERTDRLQNKRGIDVEIQKKLMKKFSPERASAALDWISAVTGEEMTGDFWNDLKDGFALIQLVLKIDGSLGKKVKGLRQKKRTKQPFKCRQNIANFGMACKKLGMKETDVCTSQDLYDGDNLNNVVNQLYALNAIAQSVTKFKGPYLSGGHKFAKKNKRNFSQETLNKTKSAVPLFNQGGVEDDSKNAYMDKHGIIKSQAKASSSVPLLSQGGPHHKDNSDYMDSHGIIKSQKKSSNMVPLLSQGGPQYENTSDYMDNHGIIKSQNKSSNAVPLFSQGGPQYKDTSDYMDSHGIIKSQGKATNVVPLLSQGGPKDESKSDYHDSYGIVKSQSQPVSAAVPLSAKGGVPIEKSNTFDSYGIVKVQQGIATGGPPPPPAAAKAGPPPPPRR